MTALLALDTATDALSLALESEDGQRRTLHRVMPRQQQQALFRCLHELLDGRTLPSLGLSAISYGRGPGSFTGLRIAASAAQGMAYALGIPVIGLSTLETQAWTFIRCHNLSQPGCIVSTIDARIGELYSACYHFDGRVLRVLQGARVTRPENLEFPEASGLVVHGVGTGFRYRDRMAASWEGLAACESELLPEAEDMLVPAAQRLSEQGGEAATDAVPEYLSERSGWKTLAEQGRPA